MGEVWRGTDTVLGRTVAVKVLLPALLSDPEFEARFRSEARILASFRHAGVVNVYDYGSDGRTMFLVMAYVEGRSLAQRLAAEGKFSPEETVPILAQAADALQAGHTTGIIHRDVKPGNLLIQPDGTVILVDFGVARSTSVTAVTQGNAIPGTALYMSPEQATGKAVSAASDVYSLGAVGYHLLTGEPPFNGNSALEVAVKHLQDEVPPLPEVIPAPVRSLIMRSMAKDPAERYQSAAAFAKAARAAATGDDSSDTLADMPALVAPETRGPRSAAVPIPTGPNPNKRRSSGTSTSLILGVAAAIVVVAGVVITMIAMNGDKSTGGANTPPAVVSSLPAVAPATTAARVTNHTTGRPTQSSLPTSPPAVAKTAPSAQISVKPEPSVGPTTTKPAGGPATTTAGPTGSASGASVP
jgi:serine/threonine-protein kinase